MNTVECGITTAANRHVVVYIVIFIGVGFHRFSTRIFGHDYTLEHYKPHKVRFVFKGNVTDKSIKTHALRADLNVHRCIYYANIFCITRSRLARFSGLDELPL